MMLLAVDTSTRMIGAALYDGVQVVAETTWKSRNHHTIELAPAVAVILESTEIEFAALKVVGVAIGPGSFTGLRIGLAFAKGLAFSLSIPIIGIPTLDVLAAAQPVSDMRLACVLEAGRSRYAVGWYIPDNEQWIPSGEMENLTIDSLIEKMQGPTLVCGEMNKVFRDRLTQEGENIVLSTPAQAVRRPALLAELSWGRWTNGVTDDPSAIKPIYFHHGEPIPG
jgi:tRNA threonylcarbamoyladenosine biosynthesis protein TsaB